MGVARGQGRYRGPRIERPSEAGREEGGLSLDSKSQGERKAEGPGRQGRRGASERRVHDGKGNGRCYTGHPGEIGRLEGGYAREEIRATRQSCGREGLRMSTPALVASSTCGGEWRMHPGSLSAGANIGFSSAAEQKLRFGEHLV